VLYVAAQRSTNDGYTCTTPVVDETTTVINGGNITTGTIDAGVVNVTNLDADNITSGTINGSNVNAQQLNILDSSGNTVATFDSTVTIGNTSKGYSQTDYNSYSLFDKNNAKYMEIGDNRDTNGRATIENVFYGDGSETWFSLSNTAYNLEVTSVTINGNLVPSTNYYINDLMRPEYYDDIVFNTAPADGAYIVVKYETEDSTYHHDFGTRAANSEIGAYSSVSGLNNEASGKLSCAYGKDNIAAGYNCYAFGENCTANGEDSIAVGNHCIASKSGSIAIGSNCTANYKMSVANGAGLTTSNDYQHVFGMFNSSPSHISNVSEYAEVVGWGIDSYHENIREMSTGGDMWLAGGLFQSSDARLKTESGTVPDVSGIRAKRFRWNDSRHDDAEHIGYYAQDVETVAPYLVSTSSDGYKSLDYIGLLCAKIESLEKRVSELEAKLGKGE